MPKEISLHVFSGPTPLQAVRQLTKALQTKLKPNDIELSSLGLHVCPNDNSTKFIEGLIVVKENMEKFEAPWDTHCLHQCFNPTLGNILDDMQINNVIEALKLLGGETGTVRVLAPHLTPMVSI